MNDWDALSLIDSYVVSTSENGMSIKLALKLCFLHFPFQNRRRVKEVAQGWTDCIKIQKAVEVSTNVKMALLFPINVRKV
jgi:hypothetical protein